MEEGEAAFRRQLSLSTELSSRSLCCQGLCDWQPDLHCLGTFVLTTTLSWSLGTTARKHKDVSFISSHQECHPTALTPDTTGPSFWGFNFLNSVCKTKAAPTLTGHNGPAIDESSCGTLFHCCPWCRHLPNGETKQKELEGGSEQTYQLSGRIPIPPPQSKARLHYNLEAMCKAVLQV